MESLITRNQEAESIRGREESTGGCAKLKTVTEMRRSRVPDTLTAENVYNFCTEFSVKLELEASGELEREE